MAAIFVLSAQPHLRVSDEAGLDFVLRKGAHLFAFGVLAILLFEALPRGREVGRRAVVAGALTVLYAGSDELHQAFVAGRGAAVTDVLIDGVGAAAALWLWVRLGPRMPIRQ